MGKVTIIVESDLATTNSLYDLMENTIDEEWLSNMLHEAEGLRADIKVFIVPSDED